MGSRYVPRRCLKMFSLIIGAACAGGCVYTLSDSRMAGALAAGGVYFTVSAIETIMAGLLTQVVQRIAKLKQ